ncbi:hypothetical protein JKP88DRAFT_264579 [Tribonema minus]|uniref:Uncharacterized protein n=1 Tax=Tribonema minus TaxID=303371 RepID=A0A835YRI6_9STRA|nr:hypothetical protein JKP88DRAFT_264579 [Tribonema minus]
MSPLEGGQASAEADDPQSGGRSTGGLRGTIVGVQTTVTVEVESSAQDAAEPVTEAIKSATAANKAALDNVPTDASQVPEHTDGSGDGGGAADQSCTSIEIYDVDNSRSEVGVLTGLHGGEVGDSTEGTLEPAGGEPNLNLKRCRSDDAPLCRCGADIPEDNGTSCTTTPQIGGQSNCNGNGSNAQHTVCAPPYTHAGAVAAAAVQRLRQGGSGGSEPAQRPQELLLCTEDQCAQSGGITRRRELLLCTEDQCAQSGSITRRRGIVLCRSQTSGYRGCNWRQ